MHKVATIIVIFLVGCANPSNQCPEPDQEALHSLNEFLAHRGEAASNQDVEGEVGRFTEDGIYMWPDGPSIEGHQALREFFTDRFSKFKPSFETKSLELEVCGPWAFERGVSTVTIQPIEKDTVIVVEEKYLNILRMQNDGSWLIHRRIRNRN